MIKQETDQLGQHLKTISADVKLYIEKRIELLLLNIGERISHVAAESIQKLIGVFLLLIGVIFTLLTLAIFLGDVMDNLTLGFLSVSVLLLVLGGLAYYLKPHSVSDYFQHQFESEVMKALSLDGDKRKASEKLIETTEQKNTQEL